MVIEVVTWKNATKTHAINQDAPTYTLCGTWIGGRGGRITKIEGVDAFPTCKRCELAVMRS